jgi:hypothetical protein
MPWPSGISGAGRRRESRRRAAHRSVCRGGPPELDNLRAAYAWATGEAGDPRVAIALAAHTGSLIDYGVEGADWLNSLRQHVEDGAVEPALAARYWRAVTASNMSGQAPWAVQVDAALRARSLYESLGQPRRVFSCLIQLARHRNAHRQSAAAREALDEARAHPMPTGRPNSTFPCCASTARSRATPGSSRRRSRCSAKPSASVHRPGTGGLK